VKAMVNDTKMKSGLVKKKL